MFLRAYSGEILTAFGVWNIGEVLGAFDRARWTGRLDDVAYKSVRKRFLKEVRRMTKLGILVLVPVRARILFESWRIVERRHIYVADALQIASARHVGANSFMTGDRRLHNVATLENINAVLLG